MQERIRRRAAARILRGPDLPALLDSAGVHGALLVTPSVYGYDNSYAIDASRLAPRRLGVVGLVQPARPDIVDVMARWRAEPGLLAVRLLVVSGRSREEMDSGGYDRLLTAAGASGVTVCVQAPGYLPQVGALAARHGNTQIVIDHMGLPSVTARATGDPFGHLPELTRLAAADNVSVKLTSLPERSGMDYPFPDVWPALERVVDAFGVDRVIWGSDVTMQRHPYDQLVDFLRCTDRLSPTDKALVLGGNLRRIFRWEAGPAG